MHADDPETGRYVFIEVDTHKYPINTRKYRQEAESYTDTPSSGS